MWKTSLLISIGVCLLFGVLAALLSSKRKRGLRRLNIMWAGVFLAAAVMFFPVHIVTGEPSVAGTLRALLLSVFNSMQIFALGCEFNVVKDSIPMCPGELVPAFELWAAVLYAAAPLFTFGFVLSLFRNLSAYIRYLLSYLRDAYIFSELNEGSLALAADIREKSKRAAIVFTDVFDGEGEAGYELLQQAENIGAICFKKDIAAVSFRIHSRKKELYFFTIGRDKKENLNQALSLIRQYRERACTNIFVFSTDTRAELMLSGIDKGEIKLRRVNEIGSLINRILYEKGELIFKNALKDEDGQGVIGAAVIGLGQYGSEMLRALSWYCQMDGYRLEINGFDKDTLASQRLCALAPELMSDKYNAADIPGEARYSIRLHTPVRAESPELEEILGRINHISYVLVALGDDERNIDTAVRLRSFFERVGKKPYIQAIVHSSEQKRALENIGNFKGQRYDIDFIGDTETSYSESVILSSELEAQALRRHLKWGNEEDFWRYEYNYRSSVAAAIHKKARISCGIPGADKSEKELTVEERDAIEALEHRRWNAYMRSQGYVYSGSRDNESRNELAKTHNDLVSFSELDEAEKRKDSSVGTR